MKYFVLAFCVLLMACSQAVSPSTPSDVQEPVDASPSVDNTSDLPTDTPESDTSLDSGSTDGGNPGDTAIIEQDYCAQIAMSSKPFQEGPGGFLFGDLAEDFTVQELDGTTWTLSENWSGCDSYLFFNYFTFQTEGSQEYMDGVWNSNLREVIQASMENVHIFFTSLESDLPSREARMNTMKARFQVALDELFPNNPDKREHWEQRVHFVTDRLTAISGSVGGFANDFLSFLSTAPPVNLGEDRGDAYAPPPLSFAIGRDQSWDPAGSLSEYVGGPSNLKMSAYNVAFFNHRAELRARLDSEENTTVVPLVDAIVTSRVFYKDVTLPDAATMAGLDTMEVDVQVTCSDRNPFACSEWDRIALISLCTEFDESDLESCTAASEIVRWITPYWRRGRRHWVMDASPFLGLVQSGGTQRFKIEMGPSWERATARWATMSVRLSNQNNGVKSRSVLKAFAGGTFNAEYNDGHEPFAFTPPVEATRVEVVTIISGHGQSDGNNCAEWCNHVHNFKVNETGENHQVSYSGIGQPFGCAMRANEGVVPGQWGNWSQSRAGWCPGLPVETVRFDVTSEVNLGVENTLSYDASYNGTTPAGGNISMSTYVVWYVD